MVKGAATIQFGNGSVAASALVDDISGNGVVLMRSCPPGKIEVEPRRVNFDDVINNPEVVIYFTNVESIDSQIEFLKELRQSMVAYRTECGENNDSNNF